jgi:transcriptional regulator with XRE-family HTH domain
MRRNVRLGELINDSIKALYAKKHLTMEKTVADVGERTGYSPATISRWRKGITRPSEETVKELLRLGREAGCDRVWAESVRQVGHYSTGLDSLIDTLWGPPVTKNILDNLPNLPYKTFIGRKEKLAELLEVLSNEHSAHLVVIEGIGGAGKTTLALEAARQCLEASKSSQPSVSILTGKPIPTFEAIIFVSAQQHILTPHGILAREQADRTLRDICRRIAETLERTHATPEEQLLQTRWALTRQRTLLVIDNLETVEDQDRILGFLYDLPPKVKVVITTREQIFYTPFRLKELTREESLDFIASHIPEGQKPISEAQARVLYEKIGGVPAALVYAIGQIATGYSIDTALAHISDAHGDVARYLFRTSVSLLQANPKHHAAYRMLMALSMFPAPALSEAIVEVAGLAGDALAADESLVQLKTLSLVNQVEGRYDMLTLTREYAMAELRSNRSFEAEARERWLQWYLDYTAEHGGREWSDWHLEYDRLEHEWDNILAVLAWCAREDRYNDILDFWFQKRISDFSNLYGYWEDRLTWLNWIMKAAIRRGDLASELRAVDHMSWTLALMGDPQQMRKFRPSLERAWELRDALSPKDRTRLARNCAFTPLRLGLYDEALDRISVFEREFEEAHLDDRDHKREQVSALYYRAEIAYRTGNLDEAKPLYREVIAGAQAIGWQRAVYYSQNWLAEIAILQSELSEAERLLQVGLPIADRNKDKRRIALYMASWARLENARGNCSKALSWAEAAKDKFQRLNMYPEAVLIESLIKECTEKVNCELS